MALYKLKFFNLYSMCYLCQSCNVSERLFSFCVQGVLRIEIRTRVKLKEAIYEILYLARGACSING